MTSTMPVQCSINGRYQAQLGPTGSWSYYEFVTNLGRALHRRRRGHGFDFLSSLKFFQAFFTQLLEDPVLPIMHCALATIGGHFLDVEKSES